MRSVVRAILTIIFSLVSCGLAFIGLLVARNVWLLLGKLHLPNYALFGLIDKALMLMAGIAALALMIYSLESYADIQILARLWQKFLRLTAPQVWFLGACHAVLAITETRLGIGSLSALTLPAVELFVGTGLYLLRRKSEESFVETQI
ncbi:MAG: hypothetical protein GX977_00265 [Firmicutes bacterium]|nr:hypothetical protein [Bacillota bacterium]